MSEFSRVKKTVKILTEFIKLDTEDIIIEE